MSIEKMREEFESAFVEEQVRNCGEGFRESALYMIQKDVATVRSAWWAWQTSRFSLRVDLPHLFPFYREGVTEALLAHGIKVNQWSGEK